MSYATEVLCVLLPVKIESTANLREHWRQRASRTQRQRSHAWAVLRHAKPAPSIGSVVVTLTRIAPRELDDDNLAHAFKAVRDGVADWLGVPDNHPAVRWLYAQRKGPPKTYSAEIAVQMGVS